MARLPSGFHWVNSRDKKAGAVGPDGTRYTRHQAETLGAQEVGFKNPYEYRKGLSGVRKLKADPGADGGRFFAPRKNYRNDLEKAKDTAARRGTKFDRAKFDATVAAMGHDDVGVRHRALNDFLFQTGRTDRPEAGY
ncbi:hypothetical protein Airi01_103280 [Actinoallomurus iriomotensis]|uniref:Uncharacterized protein n=1 Tax=Actinoallomurus iriomotensis TaxID=478107 RepID=A0A9W6RT39_9ACTN|nr:hypothetical protein Airi01_103280 [Actinoallomurus iriomotensis]